MGAVAPDAVTGVVIAAVARIGLEYAPGDLILTRIERRAHSRLSTRVSRNEMMRSRTLRYSKFPANLICWTPISRTTTFGVSQQRP